MYCNTGPYFVWKRFSPTELSYFSIPLGGSPDLFGQETQSECSLEAMTEAYEGEKALQRPRRSVTRIIHIIHYNVLYVCNLVGLVRKGTSNRSNTVVMLEKGDILS